MGHALVLGMTQHSTSAFHGDRFARMAIDRAYRAMAHADTSAADSALYFAQSCLRGQLDLLSALSPAMQGAVRMTLNTLNTYISAL